MPDSGWRGLSDVVRDELSREALLSRPPKLKTGFQELDRVLGGGLAPGLIVLGGVSNVGKSTFALQMAEHLSRQVPVLYYGLEMTAEYIGAKMVSRHLFRAAQAEEELSGGAFPQTGEPSPGLWRRVEKRCASADEIISQAEDFSPDLWERIAEARRYVEEHTRNFYVVETPLSAQKITEQVSRFIRDHPDAQRKPVVIVDYLQILPPEGPPVRNERLAVDDSIRAMVGMARMGVTVLLISALSRGVNEVRMDSFKESGSIEYSADVLLGLQFQASRRPVKRGEKFDDLAEKSKNAREVEIAVLKQRYGDSGKRVPFRYYSKYDCFEEERAPEKEEPVRKESPAVELQESGGYEMGIEPLAAVLEEWEAAQKAPAAPAPKTGEEQQNLFIPTSVMCNTKVANKLRHGAFGEGNRCKVMPGIFTEYDLLSDGPLSCFDCDVADAVYTLLSKQRRDSFTAGQVLRALSGDGRQTLTAQKKHSITQSIERLRSARIAIRCEAEMLERGGESPGPRSFEGPFLRVREEGSRYVFERGADPEMPLYAYGEKTGQMISFPQELLCVQAGGRKLSDSAETILIKRYLIRRLEILRNKQKKKEGGFRVISFQEDGDLAALLRISRLPSKEAQAQKLRRVQASVLQILEYYRQTGYIRDFKKSRRNVIILEEVQNPWKLPAMRPTPSEKDSSAGEPV